MKNKNNLPLLSPKYINDRKYWDSQWLEKKYPERFNELNNTDDER